MISDFPEIWMDIQYDEGQDVLLLKYWYLSGCYVEQCYWNDEQGHGSGSGYVSGYGYGYGSGLGLGQGYIYGFGYGYSFGFGYGYYL